MIPYEELCEALSLWRSRKGLPVRKRVKTSTTSATASASPAPAVPLATPFEDPPDNEVMAEAAFADEHSAEQFSSDEGMTHGEATRIVAMPIAATDELPWEATGSHPYDPAESAEGLVEEDASVLETESTDEPLELTAVPLPLEAEQDAEEASIDDDSIMEEEASEDEEVAADDLLLDEDEA